MKPYGSLRRSQKPTTGSHTSAIRIMSNPPILFNIQFNIDGLIWRLGLPNGIITSGFPIEILVAFLISSMLIPYPTCLTFIVLISLIIYDGKYFICYGTATSVTSIETVNSRTRQLLFKQIEQFHSSALALLRTTG